LVSEEDARNKNLKEYKMQKYYVVMSDIHFGDENCTLKEDRNQRRLINLLEQEIGEGKIQNLIFLGDILDLNLSQFPEAMEGKGQYKGFRHLIRKLEDLNIGHIIYVPGNHDYHVFQLDTYIEDEAEPLRRGERVKGVPDLWDEIEKPFLSGIVSKNINFLVSYPEWNITIPTEDGEINILLIHGHHLDFKQALGKDIRDLFKESGDPLEKKKDFEKRIALYQTIAYQGRQWDVSAKIIDAIAKTEDTISRVKRLFTDFLGQLRTKPLQDISEESINAYLEFFASEPDPEVFVFGHTHREGRTYKEITLEGKKKKVYVVNCGCFIKGETGGTAGSFVLINGTPEKMSLEERIKIYKV